MLIIFLMVYFLFLLSKFNVAIMSARSLVLLSYDAQRAYREAYEINLFIIFLQLLHQFPIFLSFDIASHIGFVSHSQFLNLKRCIRN